MLNRTGFPTPVAAKLARLPAYMLDTWNQRGVLAPSLATGAVGASNPRVYSFRDVVTLRVLAELRDSGMDLRGLRNVVKYVLSREDLETRTPDASTCLITDGREILETQGDVPLLALRKPGQCVFHIVMFGELVADLQREAREGTARAA